MKDIDNIEDWYREELNNYNVEPDKSVWDSLSENLEANAPLTEENISEWYKKEVAKLEERPDYTVWEKLATKLDTATVWDKLTLSLNRYDQIIWWRNLAIRGSAVFLLMFGSYLAYDNYTNDGNIIADNSNTNIAVKNGNTINNGGNNNTNSLETTNRSFSDGNTETTGQNDRNSTAKAKKTALNNNLSSEEQIKKAIAKAKTSLTKNSSTDNNNDNNTYASKENIMNYNSIAVENLNSLKTDEERTIYTDINRHQLTERDISHLYATSDFLVKKDKNKIVFNSKRFSAYFMFGLYARRIYVGFNAGIKKQGMITKFKENSPLAEYTQNSLIDFGSNFGGTVGFIVSDKFNLETNVNLNSTSGYKRAFDAEGVSYQENLNLSYTSVSLLGKKMNNKSTFDNKVYSTNFIGGIYASYLRAAVSDANGISRSLDEFNKVDYGIVLGIEQDRYITKTLIITPGVRYNQGLANITNNNSTFESARNFSLEFNLGVKYIFLKRGK